MAIGDQKFDPFVRLGSRGYAWWNLRPEEWRRQLQGMQGVKTRQEMTRSALGAAARRAIELSYRRLSWHVDAASDSPADVDVASFVQSCMNDLGDSWGSFINQIVANATEQGFSLHELIYKRRNGPQPPDSDEPTSQFDDGRVGWASIEMRGADTIVQWDIPMGRSWQGIYQTTVDVSSAYIPKAKLLLFRLDDRTGSPVGSGGILDDAFESWYYVKELKRIQAINIERHGGIPKITLPVGASWDETPGSDYYNAKKAVEQFAVNEQSGFVVPSGYQIDIVSPGEGARDVVAVIDSHRQDFFRSVLLSFLMLGAGNTGSWALSKDQSDFFIMALEGWLSNIEYVLNTVAVPRLVDLNAFPGRTGYPRIVHSPIAQRDVLAAAAAFQQLAQSGWITPTPKDEEWFRNELGLPERSADDIEKAQQAAADAVTLQESVRAIGGQPSPGPMTARDRSAAETFAAAADGADRKRRKLEQEHAKPIGDALGEQMDVALAENVTDPKVVAGRVSDDSAALREALDKMLQAGVSLGVSEGARLLGAAAVGIDWDLVNEDALAWARDYGYNLVKGINDTSRKVLQDRVGAWIESGEPLDALRENLAPWFGEMRGAMIAETEVTRAFAQGNTQAWQASDAVKGFVFNTAQDELVCEICSPLDGQTFDLGDDANTPPLHTRCRCWIAPAIEEG